MTEPLQWFTVTETATLLGLHRNTILRMVKRKELPVYRLGTRRDIRIAQKDIDAWLEARRVG